MNPLSKISVLFLCTGNSARSQMAEAFLRHYGGDAFEAFSAGLQPKGIHPLTRQVMQEVSLSLEGQRSKDVSEYMGKRHFSYLITVCAHAEKNCPRVFPGVGQRLHWDMPDPAALAAALDDEQARLDVFRQARDEMFRRIQSWIQDVRREITA